MTHISRNHPENFSAHREGFIHAPVNSEEPHAHLEHPHDGKRKPLINVAEMPDVYIIEVAAPGLRSGDFHVSMTKNVLTISVLKKDAAITEKLYHQHEFNYSCFKREIVLPGNVDADFLSAAYEGGILCVRLPKCKKPVMNHVERIIIY